MPQYPSIPSDADLTAPEDWLDQVISTNTTDLSVMNEGPTLSLYLDDRQQYFDMTKALGHMLEANLVSQQVIIEGDDLETHPINIEIEEATLVIMDNQGRDITDQARVVLVLDLREADM